jgi:hypothetical protein
LNIVNSVHIGENGSPDARECKNRQEKIKTAYETYKEAGLSNGGARPAGAAEEKDPNVGGANARSVPTCSSAGFGEAAARKTGCCEWGNA